MKKKMILGLAVAHCFFASANVFATSDDYPAADFQPTVIFVDEDAVNAVSSGVGNREVRYDPRYPAADFQPKVVFLDQNASNSRGGSSRKQDMFDPKYPAAYYQPKVIFP